MTSQTPKPEFGAPLMDLLSPALAAQLWALAKMERYKAGQIIHHRGDDRPGLSIVRRGMVEVGTLGRDGRMLSIGTLREGDSFGEFSVFAALPRTHDISAVTDSEIAQIPAAKFRTLCDAEPVLLKAVLQVALIRSHAALERLDDNARLSLPARIAKRVLSGVDTEVTNFEVPLTQDALAGMMGVSRVSIGKALSKLTCAGHMRLGYGRMYIDDAPRLRAWVAAQQQTERL